MTFAILRSHLAAQYLRLYAADRNVPKLTQPDLHAATADMVIAITSPEVNMILADRIRRDDILLAPFSTRDLFREILRRFKEDVCVDGSLTEFDRTILHQMVRHHVTHIENETAN